MQLRVELLRLRLKTPFRIAHGISLVRENVLLRLGDGLGEAAVVPYYPYSQEQIIRYLEALDPAVLVAGGPLNLHDNLDRIPDGPPPARAAVDIALHDLWAKALGHPLYRLWGLNSARSPASSYTLSIPDDAASLPTALHEAPPFPIYKLKLGSGDPEADLDVVRRAYDTTQARLCVDANGAWTVDEAAFVIPRLATYDVLFIEQPLAANPHEDWHRLRALLPEGIPPLIADESLQEAADVPALAGAADGINVKLAKAGGLREAHRLIAVARSLGMHVMVGCMIESAVAVTATAHLAPLADFVDLDGSLQLADDPFHGVTLDKGRIRFPDRAGLGVS